MMIGEYLPVSDLVDGVATTTYDNWCIFGFRWLLVGGNSSGYYDRSMLFDTTTKPFSNINN